MKKLISVLIVALFALGLSACVDPKGGISDGTKKGLVKGTAAVVGGAAAAKATNIAVKAAIDDPDLQTVATVAGGVVGAVTAYGAADAHSDEILQKLEKVGDVLTNNHGKPAKKDEGK